MAAVPTWGEPDGRDCCPSLLEGGGGGVRATLSTWQRFTPFLALFTLESPVRWRASFSGKFWCGGKNTAPP
jgi:hypothetical protein